MSIWDTYNLNEGDKVVLEGFDRIQRIVEIHDSTDFTVEDADQSYSSTRRRVAVGAIKRVIKKDY